MWAKIVDTITSWINNIFKKHNEKKVKAEKYDQVEAASVIILHNRYTEYEKTKSKEELQEAVNIALFCRNAGINGRTTEVIEKIMTEWNIVNRG